MSVKLNITTFILTILHTSLPPAWRAATSSALNLAIDTDLTRCVNSRLKLFQTQILRNYVFYSQSRLHAQLNLNMKIIKERKVTYCTPLQFVQTNVQNVVQTYCGPWLDENGLWLADKFSSRQKKERRTIQNHTSTINTKQ